MKREDYVKKATARIFDSRQKRAVTAELEDHIAHRTQALEEIGYDPERAEAQGVEAMGDPAEICDQLGALHNRFYTPVWDIVFLLLWGGLLAGAYFALRQYVFGDVGLTALLNAGACLVPGCACLYGVWCLYQNHPVTAVLYALGLGGSGVYLYFLLQKLSATMGGRFANWQAFLFHQEILKHQGLYANDRAVAGGIAGLLAPGVLLLPAARLEPTGAYIDSDGYLVTGVQVKEKQKDGSVIGSDGKTYYPYLRTGWTAQGKPRMAHQPSELEEMLQSLDTAQNTE